MIYLRNRYYDPSLRRFISVDPAKDGINWYAYCGNNPVNYWDPTGKSPRITLGSLQSALEHGVSFGNIRDAFYIQKGCTTLSVEYAGKHGMERLGNYRIKTWSNEADAYRHVTWNARMVEKMGYDKALKISSAHEIAFLREHKLVTYVTDSNSTLRNAFMPLETLMDIWNNSRGVDIAVSGNYWGSEEAFATLLNNGDLITSPAQVAEKYGFDELKMKTGLDGIKGFEVTFDYSNGYLYSEKIWLKGTRRGR